MGPWKSFSRGSAQQKGQRLDGRRKPPAWRGSAGLRHPRAAVAESCHSSFPFDRDRAQSRRSPMWARIWAGVRDDSRQIRNSGKLARRPAQGLAGTIGQRGDDVTHHFPVRIGAAGHHRADSIVRRRWRSSRREVRTVRPAGPLANTWILAIGSVESSRCRGCRPACTGCGCCARFQARSPRLPSIFQVVGLPAGGLGQPVQLPLGAAGPSSSTSVRMPTA